MSSSGVGKGGGSAVANGYVPSHSWLMQETAGASLADSLNGNLSPLAISGTFTLAAAQLPGFAASNANVVEVNGGTGGIVSPPQPAGMAAMGFMMMFWWMTTGSVAASPVIGGYGTTTGVVLQHAANNTLIITQSNVGPKGSVGVSPDGLWRRLALFIQPAGTSASGALFLNGALAVTSSPFSPTANPADTVVIGCNGPGSLVPLASFFSRVKVVPCVTLSDAAIIALSDYNGQIGLILP